MISISTSNKTKLFIAFWLLVFSLKTNAQTYCTTTYLNGNVGGNYISLVKIPTTTLNNASLAALGAYKLFPASGSSTATLLRGNTYTLQVAGGTAISCYIAAWADWNHNGVFESNESLGFSSNAGNSTTVSFTGGISVPVSAYIGTTRLRFRSCSSNNPSLVDYPCNAATCTFGETEDYTITIACQFTNPPNPGFTFSDSIFVKSPSTLVNTNTILESNKWYINSVYDTNTINLKHTFSNTGTYNICLKSTNCFGTDSSCMPVVVYNPTQKPIADFSSSSLTVATFQQVTLTDISKKGPYYWQWAFSPSSGITYLSSTNSNSQNPIVHFTIPGTYQVCLWDSNDIGRSSTVCKNIVVSPNNQLCIYPFETDLIQGCFTDEGGITGNYSSNSGTCTFLIDACADTVKLKFTQFNLSSNSYLRIYNGRNNTAPALHSGLGFTGTSLPGGTIGLTASSGKMYIEFQKGNSAPGFLANWTTTPTTEPPPLGRIDASDSADDCGGISTYQYISNNPNFKYEDAVYHWDLNYFMGNTPSISQKGQFIVAWSFSTSGVYIIRLEVETCGGIEIVYDTVTVIHPTSVPKVKFIIAPSTILIGDTITLTDQAKFIPIWRQWTITGPAGQSIVSGNTSSAVYKIKITLPGVYTIQLKDSSCVGSNMLTKTFTTYCYPVVSNLNSDLSIKRFELNTINKLTNDSNNILNFTNTNPAIGTITYRDNTKPGEAQAKLGDSISFKVERLSAIAAADIRIWIDYNQDGVFQSIEMVASSTSVAGNYFIGNFVIPLTAKTNYTRIRIGTSSTSQPNSPCGVNASGDFNDYHLKLFPGIIFPNNSDTVYVEVGRIFNDPGIVIYGAAQTIHSGKPFGSIVTVYPSLSVHTITSSDVYENITTNNLFVKATKDITKPVITRIGADTIYTEGATSYIDPGATATDFYFGSLSSSIIKHSNVDSTTLGSYFVSYHVTDLAGNIADSVSRIVIVRDTKAPKITLIGKDTIVVDVNTLTAVPEPGFTVADNFYQFTSLIISVDYSKVNLNKIGTYPVRYFVSDSSGNMDSSKVRVYNVKDTSAPVITLIGNIITNWIRWKPYVDPGNIVTDNYDKNLICVPDVSTIIIYLPGLYAAYFNITDSSGNKAKQVLRYVNVGWEGIEEITIQDLFVLYPNPSQGLVNILFNEESESISGVYIYDAKGSVVFSKENVPIQQHSFQINLSKETPGLYFIKVINGNKVGTKYFSIVR